MIKIILFLTIMTIPILSQGITIDNVYSFTPGTGQNIGQGEEYYPENIFGLPSRNASEDFGESSPEEVLSLGLNGEIIVEFSNYSIIDGDGADFTIFENAFKNPFNNLTYAEPAIVSVSLDGVNFFEFPYDSTTLKGMAGVTPTNGKQDPFTPDISGGDRFDLSDIGIKKIRYIKIKDATEIIKNNPNHPYYDVTLTGFDLDAVVGLNYESISTSLKDNDFTVKLYQNEIISPKPIDIQVVKYSGEVIKTSRNQINYDLSTLPIGAYIIVCSISNQKKLFKYIQL